MARILIVDDEPSLRLMTSMVLQAEGHDTEEAGNGREALELVENEIPDEVPVLTVPPYVRLLNTVAPFTPPPSNQTPAVRGW